MRSVALGCLLDKVRLGDATVSRRGAAGSLPVGGTRDSNREPISLLGLETVVRAAPGVPCVPCVPCVAWVAA